MVNNILRKNAELHKEKQNLLNKIEKEIKNTEKIKLKLEKLLTIYEQQYDKILVIKMFKNKIPQKNRNKINGDEKKIEKKIINTLKEIKYLVEKLINITDLKRKIMENMNKPFQNFISVHFRNTSRNGNRR
jgi:CRISPR/Cas system-associated endonuclease Cas3-HD